MPPKPYMTAREVADFLKLNVETIYLLIAREQLPAVRVGGRWRFDEAELREWLTTHCAANVSSEKA